MTDPLAAALADMFGWPADGWESVARAAREHISAEIQTRMDEMQAEGLDSTELVWWWRGMDDATRIAGRRS